MLEKGNIMEINFASKDIDELLKRNPELLPDSVTGRLMQPDQMVSFSITATCRDKAAQPEDTNRTHYLRWGTFLSFIGYMASLSLAMTAAWISPWSMPVASWLFENLGFLPWLASSFWVFLGYMAVGHLLTGAIVALIGLAFGKKPVLYRGSPIPIMLLVDNETTNFQEA